MLGNNFFNNVFLRKAGIKTRVKAKGKSRGSPVLPVFLILLIVCLPVFLSACNGLYNPQPKEVNYYEGAYGLEIAFLEDSPPLEIYENSTFNINLIVENKGAFDVVNDNFGILSINFDPFYIGVNLSNTNNIKVTKNGIVLRGVQLPGKSVRYPYGLETFLNLPYFRIKSITGQREKPTTQIFASLCYPYVTTLAKHVCIDYDAYGQNLRKQVCYEEDLVLSDQGAPLAVTLVEVDNQPVGNNVVRPVFTIHVSNKGSGSVLSPALNAAELDRVCSFTELYREDFNTVGVQAVLSDSMELECSPNPLRLFDGRGITRCQVRNDDLTLRYQNYEAPLLVNLSYTYLTSISADIEIKRFNVYGQLTSPDDQCMPYQVQVGGTCRNKCDVCASNMGGAVGGEPCQPPIAKYKIDYQTGFACMCSLKTCESLYPKGLCVPFAGFCPGASYCCLPECTSSEIRGPDGKCYKKCSSCYAAKNNCACGNDDDGYIVMEEGRFCCHKYKSTHDEQQECKDACSISDSST